MTKKQDVTQHSSTSFSTAEASKIVKRFFLPERCEHCNRLIPFCERDCIYCSSKQYLIPEEFCIHCNKRICTCDGSSHRLNLSVPYIYSGSIRHYIHRYKFKKEKPFADFFAESIYKALINDFGTLDFDYITFIPSAEGKHRKFNHSELISKSLTARLFGKCVPLLKRNRPTLRQHHLSHADRITNMNNAFSVIDGTDLKGKTVLICDDIKTTGSTLRAAEKALLEAGAEKVYCCAVATPVFATAPPLDKEIEKL